MCKVSARCRRTSFKALSTIASTAGAPPAGPPLVAEQAAPLVSAPAGPALGAQEAAPPGAAQAGPPRAALALALSFVLTALVWSFFWFALLKVTGLFFQNLAFKAFKAARLAGLPDLANAFCFTGSAGGSTEVAKSALTSEAKAHTHVATARGVWGVAAPPHEENQRCRCSSLLFLMTVST